MMLERLLGAAGFQLEAELVNAIRPSELLERYHTGVAETLARYPVSQAWVFGSVARRDDLPDSNLDLLVEMKPEGSFLHSVNLREELSALLGCQVDVVTTKGFESNALFRRDVNRDRRLITTAARAELAASPPGRSR
jgi:predicted nucleotidyltransferase